MKSDYNAARAEAQRLADEDGFDRGLERNPFYGWTHFLLPGKSYRAGHELRCEVVSCSDLKRPVAARWLSTATPRRRITGALGDDA